MSQTPCVHYNPSNQDTSLISSACPRSVWIREVPLYIDVPTLQHCFTPLLSGCVLTGQAAGVSTQQANPAMTNQILQNWAKYLQMNFGGLTPQQLASNPLYQQMVRQQQQYWAMLRQQQQLLQLQHAGVAGVAVPGRTLLTPAQMQQLQSRMALSQSALNQAVAHARLQHLQQTQQQPHQQQSRNSLGHVGVPATAIPVSGQSTTNLGHAVRLGQSQGTSVLLKSSSQSTNRPPQPSQNVPAK